MKVHILLADGSSGGTVYNVRAVEQLPGSSGTLVCRMEFSDTPKVLPRGAYVNVEPDEADDEEDAVDAEGVGTSSARGVGMVDSRNYQRGRREMKVFVVITEWNRGYDLEGGFTLEGVYASKKSATAANKALIKHYK